MTQIGVVLFRGHDLRVVDHGPLHTACSSCKHVFPVFIWAGPDQEAAELGFTRARVSEVLIGQSVKALQTTLESKGSKLVYRLREKDIA